MEALPDVVIAALGLVRSRCPACVPQNRSATPSA
jgi:hypothetical protein